MMIDMPIIVVTVRLAASSSLAPNCLPARDSSAGGKDIFNGNHNEQQRDSNTYGCQSNVGIQKTDVSSVNQIVNSLCQQRKRGRNCQLYDGFGWGYIPQHRLCLFCRHIVIIFFRLHHIAECSAFFDSPLHELQKNGRLRLSPDSEY